MKSSTLDATSRASRLICGGGHTIQHGVAKAGSEAGPSTLTSFRRDSRDDARQLDGRFGLSKLHVEARGSLEVVDWIVLDIATPNSSDIVMFLVRQTPHAEIGWQL